ncbi:MAG: T9SS type A sorting domain-containing protein [Chitinophagales bacterium]
MNLKHYTAMAASFLALKKESDAQIIYTDIPDTIIYIGSFANPESYALDLNNDGQTDFRFDFSGAQFASSGYEINLFTLNEYLSGNPNQIEGNMHDASALIEGDTISKAKPWISASFVYMGYFASSFSGYNSSTIVSQFFSSGNWVNVNNRYLGVRLILSTDTLYGWIRMDVAVKDSVVIKDYAYNTVAGEEIIAGEGSIPVNVDGKNKEGDFDIFPNPAASMMHLKLGEEFANGSMVTIIDLSGKKVFSRYISTAGVSFNISQLMKGTYFIEIKNNAAIKVKKFEIAR